MAWTLQDIRNKVRRITGRKSLQQMANDTLDKYINDYLTEDLVEDIKVDSSRQEILFYTDPDADILSISGYSNVQPEVYVQNRMLNYYQDWNRFNEAVPEYYTEETLGTGDGITAVFSGLLTAPILKGSLMITDDTEVFNDALGTGILTGGEGGTGTIDYLDGSWSVTFNTAPTSLQSVYASYVVYKPGMPTDVLVFGNQLIFYPVPDKVYQVKCVGYKTPSPLSSPSSSPDDEEWGPLIAIGAARQIFLDNGETERIAEIEAMFDERKRLLLRRTLETTNYERAMPRF